MAENPAHPTPDEAALVRESRAGSPAAFDRLVHELHPRVFGFLLTLTRNRQDAEDLTQDTFVRAWRKLHHFDPSRPLLPWLLTIARRQSISMLRKKRPLPALEIDTIIPAPEPSIAPDLWRIAERHLTRDAFSALWLHYREDLPLAEVGRILGKREGAVKVLLHRARKTLAEAIPNDPSGPPPLPVTPPPLPSIWNNAQIPS